MLKNKKTVYFCQECGYESAKWMGQCPACKAWNTFVEETVSSKKSASSNAKISQKKTEPVILRDIRNRIQMEAHKARRHLLQGRKNP